MVKYSSRVTASGNAATKKRGPPATKKRATKGGDIAIAGGLNAVGGSKKGGALKKAITAAKVKPASKAKLQAEVKELEAGGDIQSGGSFGSDFLRGFTKVIPIPGLGGDIDTGDASAPLVPLSGVTRGDTRTDTTAEGGGFVEDVVAKVESGVTDVGKKVKEKLLKKAPDINRTISSLRGIVDKLSHNDMIQVLQHMAPSQFHILQGVAGAHLPQFTNHPITGIAKKVLGGSFVHPRSISKMATRDITRAITPQQLATALHMEMLDMRKGQDVGGGLLDSLKHHFKRGFEGLKSGVSAGNRIGNVLNSALKTGIQAGQAFSPILQTLFPESTDLIKGGLSSVEALQVGLEKGIRIGEQVEQTLQQISPIETEPEVADVPEVIVPTQPDLGASEFLKQVNPITAQLTENPIGSGLSMEELRTLGFA